VTAFAPNTAVLPDRPSDFAGLCPNCQPPQSGITGTVSPSRRKRTAFWTSGPSSPNTLGSRQSSNASVSRSSLQSKRRKSIHHTRHCVASSGVVALAPLLYATAIRSTGVGWVMGLGRLGSFVGTLAIGLLSTGAGRSTRALSQLGLPRCALPFGPFTRRNQVAACGLLHCIRSGTALLAARSVDSLSPITWFNHRASACRGRTCSPLRASTRASCVRSNNRSYSGG
jgi:hypothetical protein